MADRDVLRALNEDIWHEFCRAYAARDAKALVALYSSDLIRAGGPSMRVSGLAEFARQMTQWFDELTERGVGVDIEFRFLERLASGDLASERGIFQITSTLPTGEQRALYGKFHTFARKLDGGWRLAVDYDSDEAGTVTEETFTSGAEVDDLARFDATTT